MALVAIIGGHGKIALQLTQILAARGDSVTSIIRDPSQAGEVAAAGGTPVVANVEALVTSQIADVLRGCDAVVWCAGAGGGNPARTYAVDRDAAIRSMDAAARAGIDRYVMVSYLGSRPNHGVAPDNPFFPYAEAKAAADTYLCGTQLQWTILGPSTLTSEPGTGLITVNPEATTGHVPRADVARVAAAVLERPATIGKVIRFIGGQTPIDQALN